MVNQKKEIIAMIQKRIDDIPKNNDLYDKEIAFLDQFLNKVKLDDVLPLATVSNADLLALSLMLDNSIRDLEEIKVSIKELIVLLQTVDKKQVNEALIRYSKKLGFPVNVFGTTKEIYLVAMNLKNQKDCIDPEECYYKFLLLLENKLLVEIVSHDLNSMCELVRKQEGKIGHVTQQRLFDKAKEQCEKILFHDGKELYEILRMLDTLYKEYTKEKNEELKQKLKMASLYNSLLNILSRKDVMTIINYDVTDLISLDPQLASIFIHYISTLLDQNFQTLKESNDKMEASMGLDSLDRILLKYNILGSSLTKEVREMLNQYGNLETIDAILEELFKNNFPITRHLNFGLVYVLIESSIDQVREILRLCNAGIITSKFLQQHLGLFIKAHRPYDKNINAEEFYNIIPLYDLVKANFEVFKSEAIDFNNINTYNSNMLLENEDVIRINANLLDWYNVSNKSTRLNNGQILIKGSIMDLVDYFIEQGYDLNLINQINFLGIDVSDSIKRLELSKKVEFQGMNSSVVKEAIENQNYLTTTGNIDEYVKGLNQAYFPSINRYYLLLASCERQIISNQLNKSSVIDNLDNSYRNDNDSVYNIDGIVISRNKVLRNLTTILNNGYNIDTDWVNILVASIIYNSYLEKEQIEQIIASITNNPKIIATIKGKSR